MTGLQTRVSLHVGRDGCISARCECAGLRLVAATRARARPNDIALVRGAQRDRRSDGGRCRAAAADGHVDAGWARGDPLTASARGRDREASHPRGEKDRAVHRGLVPLPRDQAHSGTTPDCPERSASRGSRSPRSVGRPGPPQSGPPGPRRSVRARQTVTFREDGGRKPMASHLKTVPRNPPPEDRGRGRDCW
jgi:hypothetical protein